MALSTTFMQCTLESTWLPVHQRIEYKLAVLTFKIRRSSTSTDGQGTKWRRKIAEDFNQQGAPTL